MLNCCHWSIDVYFANVASATVAVNCMAVIGRVIALSSVIC